MILAIGEILFDIYADHIRIGGAPFNFAYHLRRMGLPVRLITRIGNDDFGRRIAGILREARFDLEDVQVDNRHPSGVVEVMLDGRGVPQYDIRADVAYDYLDLDRVRPLNWSQIDIVYYGTLQQRTERAFERLHAFLAQAGDNTLRFCDLNLRPPFNRPEVVAASMHQADILKLNREEFSFVLTHMSDIGAMADPAQGLMRHYAISTLAVTDGARGCRVIHQGLTFDVPAPEVPSVVDTVGAGDAYAAVLAAGIVKALPMRRTLTLAGDFAARICGIPGAIPDDPTIYPKLAQA